MEAMSEAIAHSAAGATVSLWLTGSEKAAVIVTFPLLLALGVISIHRS